MKSIVKTSNKIYDLACLLWPINRSITGEGVRKTLSIIKSELPDLEIYEVPSGTQVFDWTVPMEWRVNDAYIITPFGEKICNFKENNLHLVGYSAPIHTKLTLLQLQEHLYSLPNQPSAIPYVTSYYEKRWGFCISDAERQNLKDGMYEVFIDSSHFNGSLTYAELLIKGASSKEVFLSTYICHPSMANNELSGPCVTTFLAKKIKEFNHRRYSYRIIFIPETIGSIVYLNKNLEYLKSNVIAGFNISCVGDDRSYSYLPSRGGQSLSDKVAKHCLKHICPTYKSYSWVDRGSDERQYCAPGVDLPVASIMRTKYGEYDEYHTSLDNLINVVTPDGLEGAYNAILKAIEAIENNLYPKTKIICEPQLGRRGLYPTLSRKQSNVDMKLLTDFISWCDGENSTIEIADKCNTPIWELYPIIKKLVDNNLIEQLEYPSPF